MRIEVPQNQTTILGLLLTFLVAFQLKSFGDIKLGITGLGRAKQGTYVMVTAWARETQVDDRLGLLIAVATGKLNIKKLSLLSMHELRGLLTRPRKRKGTTDQ
ncbi:unnamed protein product [Dovyalis caffra]|uniref:Uncharacterized protein n=1 Tax=Dovyalis caffra TaxID=77055 RepID=A0AAV1RAL5_9ROSI|nr:unnamed protein product [Dovyalis caffra]